MVGKRRVAERTYRVAFNHLTNRGQTIRSTERTVSAKNKDEAKKKVRKQMGEIWGVTVTRV